MSKTKSSIPNALKVGKANMPDSMGQRMYEETRVIEPSEFSQKQTRFLFPKTGILSSSAYVTYALKAANANQRQPLRVGLMGCIRQAEIFVGSQVWATTQDANHLRGLLKNFKNPNDSQLKEASRICGFRNTMIETQFQGGAANANLTGKVCMDSSRPGISRQDNISANGGPAAVNAFDVEAPFRITTDANTTPEATIYLADLFEWFYQVQLPLQLLDDQVSLVITWEDDVNGGRVVPTAGNAFAAGNDIVQDKTKLVVDLIYYDDEPGMDTMGALEAEMKKGIELVYSDYIQINHSLPAVTAPGANSVNTQKVSPLLGLARQNVRNLYMSIVANTGIGNSVLGHYESIPSFNDTTLQLKVNSEPVYSQALDSDAKLWNELSLTHRQPYAVGQHDYTLAGLTDKYLLPAPDYTIKTYLDPYTTSTIYGHPHTAMTGSQSYKGLNLSHTRENVVGAGMAIGDSPCVLELNYDRTAADAAAVRLLKIWAEVERVCVMRDGKIYFSGA